MVVPKYKLIFFWNSKSGGTKLINLLQYIQGLNITGPAAQNPRTNGLTHLAEFDLKNVVKMFLINLGSKQCV